MAERRRRGVVPTNIAGAPTPGVTRIENVLGCARCGEDHNGVEFRRLTHPIEVGDTTLTHWAPCPTNSEPILLHVTPDHHT